MRLLFSLGQHSPGTVPVHRRIGEVAVRLQERQNQHTSNHQCVDESYILNRMEVKTSYVAILREGVSPRIRSRLLNRDVSVVEEVCG